MSSITTDITKAITKLRTRGYVDQTVSTSDARVREVGLTPSGRVVTQHLYDVGDELVGRIVSEWAPEQVRAFTASMQQFVTAAISQAR